MNYRFCYRALIIASVICLSYLTLCAQRKARIVFYNVENLFDPFDDSLTNDNEFLPSSQKKWDYNRFQNKLTKIYKVLAAVGENEAPEIVAFAEIENRFVLQQLITKTPMIKYPYEIIHVNSPDTRGIDVAIIYRTDKIKLLKYETIEVKFDNSSRTTRDILMAEFSAGKNEEFYLFVNHWPSRMGGQQRSEHKRMTAASCLRRKVDSVTGCIDDAKIIICGDFNDNPDNNSLTETLNAIPVRKKLNTNQLYNLSYSTKEQCRCGTLKYKSSWDFFDQFIVTGNLLTQKSLKTENSFSVFNAPFILEKDTKYGGDKPYRTYLGPAYKNGFSDHLPVYLDLF